MLALGILLLGCCASLFHSIQLARQAQDTPAIAGDRADLEAALSQIADYDTEAWHNAWEPFLTDKWQLVDAAEGWAVLAACLGVALVVAVGRMSLGSRHPFTPSRKFTAPLLVGLIAAAQIPFVGSYYEREVLERECCPWWADTPIMAVGATMTSIVVYLVLIELAVAVLLKSGGLPAALSELGTSWKRQVLSSLLVLPLLAVSLLVVSDGLRGLPSTVALGLAGAWAVLVGRAAAVSPPVSLPQ